MTSLLEQTFATPATDAQIRAFQDWETQNAEPMLSRYAELPAACVFGVRPTDVVTPNDRVVFEFSGNEPRLFDAAGRYLGTIANAPVELIKRFVAALDGKRTLVDVCSQPSFAAHAGGLYAFVAALLGGPFLLPATLRELEARLPAIEVLRFPSQSRYAMPREYWENQVAVRQALELFYAGLDDFAAFSNGLRGLHRLATLGVTGKNYYGGVGGVPTVPGEFRTMAITNRFSDRKKRIFGAWLRLLDVPNTAVESGLIVSTNKVALIRVTDAGHECEHPYGRTGEQLASQLHELRAELAAARAAAGVDRDRFLRHCALFHHAFVHAHPFGNINNSIAMNIVNDLLRQAGVGVVPHLYFDQVAHFLQPEDYVRLFRRAVEAHVVDDGVGHDRPATQALLEAVTRVAEVAG